MSKVYLATKDDLTAALATFAASVGASTASVDDGTPVGRVVFDYVLRDGYVKANGATVINASVNYPRLVAFLQVNSDRTLAVNEAAWEANKVLYLYNETDDKLTLPDYTGLVMQGCINVEEKQPGLPNITGQIRTAYGNGTITGAFLYNGTTYAAQASGNYTDRMTTFDASRCSSIYGGSNTVQPHAAGLIPQIRY